MNAHPASHPTDRTLHAYGLGKLDDASAESVNAHLESCPDCRQRVAALTSDSFLGRLRDAHAQPDSFRPAVSSTDGLSLLDGGATPAAPPPVSTLPPGLADLPDYEILRELGQGGMGVVFLAQNTLMGRMEVLKVVSGQLVNRRGVLDRFLGEIRNAAKLHHPNIVAAYSALRLGESFVLSMEYVEGLDLSRLVKARGPLPVANSCNYVHQAALGLQHAHEHGMVHRDIKPSNLMLTLQGTRAVVKVLDFGLAKVQSEGAVDGGLTHEGQMLGTPDYIAPEQISNARLADIRADIYSLGCTLYYLLTGKPPFRGDSLYDILQAHHSMDATPLNLVRPEVPAEVAAIVAKMMSKEPGRRFQEPKEVAQALKPFFTAGNVASVGSKPEVSRAAPAEPKRETVGASSVPIPSAAGPEPAAASPGSKPGHKPRSEPMWESLVDLKETGSSPDRAPAVASNRRPPWLWPVVAVGVLLLAFIAVWASGVIKIKTPEGYIVLIDLDPQATVLLDGTKAIVHWPDGGGPAEITVVPGEHVVQVKKDGFKIHGQKVTVERDGRTPLMVQLEPLETPRPGQGAASERSSRPESGKIPTPRGGGGVVSTSPPPQSIDVTPDHSPTPRPEHAVKLLFNGKDLTGWTAFARGRRVDASRVARVSNGEISLIPAAGGLRTERSYRNFTLKLEYPFPVGGILTRPGSGVIILPESGDGLSYQGGIEGQIRPNESGDFWTEPGASLVGQERRGGSGYVARRMDAERPPGEWNVVIIRCEGPRITYELNGREVNRAESTRPISGWIGLMNQGSDVRFRNIEIAELSDTPGGPGAATTSRVATPFPDGDRSWRLDGQELVQSQGEGTIILGDASLSRFDMKFKAMIVSGREGFVAIFHHTSPQDFRFIHVGESAQKEVVSGFMYNGQEGGEEPKEMPLQLGRWYDVFLKVRDSEYWCYLDDEEIFHGAGPDARFTRGRIGLATWDAKARFCDIIVTSPEDKEL
jgi:serine/threonine protein kinase